MQLTLNARVENLPAFFEDMKHVLRLDGTIRLRSAGDGMRAGPPREYPVTGDLQLMVDPERKGIPQVVTKRHKEYGLERPGVEDADAVKAIQAQRRIARGASYATRTVAPASPSGPEQRFMYYTLRFEGEARRRWRLEGYKRVRDDPDPNAWRDTSWLFVRLMEDGGATQSPSTGNVHGAGIVHVDFAGLMKQLRSFARGHGNPGGRTERDPTLNDPARTAWTIGTFGAFFFGNLQRIYFPQVHPIFDALCRPPTSGAVS